MPIISKHLSLKNIFLAFVIYLCCLNVFHLPRAYQRILAQNKGISEYLAPGTEFMDFNPLLRGVKHAGFMTNKAMSPERNDGQFLAAQYILAPVILDFNASHQFLLFDYTDLMSAYREIQRLKTQPVYINKYGKILVERKP